jgi:hypothetical protein
MLSYAEHGKFRAQTQVWQQVYRRPLLPGRALLRFSTASCQQCARLRTTFGLASGSRDWHERNGQPTLALRSANEIV